MEIKNKIQIGIILYIILSILGYVYYPITTLTIDVLIIMIIYLLLKKKNIKFKLTKKNKK
jgi:hypothetical protein